MDYSMGVHANILNYSNEEMVNKIIMRQYIKDPRIEEAFRIVDRKYFVAFEYEMVAHNLSSFRYGHVIIGDAATNAVALEVLDLEPGMKFLHIGPGSSYFCTLVGLLVGHTGVVHGVEKHTDAVKYSDEKLDLFLKENAKIMKHLDFCKPEFFVGKKNILEKIQDVKYDRIYISHRLKNIPVVGDLLQAPGFRIQKMNGGFLIKLRKTFEDNEEVELFRISKEESYEFVNWKFNPSEHFQKYFA